MKTVVTHSGGFHADDVFAIATLQLALGRENLKIIRTRDRAVIEEADYAVDIGGVYDHELRCYDHHQEGAPVRENGIPYAAFGLVWKHYGPGICQSEYITQRIDETMCQSIDAGDNGIQIWDTGRFGLEPIVWDNIVKNFRSLSYDGNELDERFEEIVAFSYRYLELKIAKETKRLADKQEAEAFYNSQNDTEILTSNKPMGRNFFIQYEEVKVLVCPRNDESGADWVALAIEIEEGKFATRVSFPESWRGLRDEALSQVSMIPDAVFCHKDGYMFVSQSKESAIEAAKHAK